MKKICEVGRPSGTVKSTASPVLEGDCRGFSHEDQRPLAATLWASQPGHSASLSNLLGGSGFHTPESVWSVVMHGEGVEVYRMPEGFVLLKLFQVALPSFALIWRRARDTGGGCVC